MGKDEFHPCCICGQDATIKFTPGSGVYNAVHSCTWCEQFICDDVNCYDVRTETVCVDGGFWNHYTSLCKDCFAGDD